MALPSSPLDNRGHELPVEFGPCFSDVASDLFVAELLVFCCHTSRQPIELGQDFLIWIHI